MNRYAPGITFFLRVCLGFIFIYSGWHKLSRPIQEFEYVIEQYQTFPSSLIHLIALVVPWLEFLGGICLVLGFLRLWSARFLLSLSASFILLLSSILLRGIDLSHCGCFGEGIHLTVSQALVLDSLMALALTYLSVEKAGVVEISRWIDSQS